LNLKGTREKKLQEGLKKIKGTIKLKKPKKLVRNDVEEVGGKEDADKEGEDVEMIDDNDSKQQEPGKENDDQVEVVDKNHLFENDQSVYRAHDMKPQPPLLPQLELFRDLSAKYVFYRKK
jgi:hypothetical protein